MTRTLWLAAGPGELRAAVLEAGEPVELRVERDGGGHLGEVHLGRVVGTVPALPGAFVEIGLDRPALLEGKGASTLPEGSAVVVEVHREPRAGKAAGVKLRPEIAAPAGHTPPALLAGLAPAERVVADAAAEAVVVESPGTAALLRPLTRAELRIDPALPARLAELFDAALEPRVPLAGGGAIVVEATQATTLIDVDAGAAVGRRDGAEQTALAVNLAAAVEIARQVRLRGISGAIVVDFVSLRRRENRDRVSEALGAALPGAEIKGWTRLGHVELTRRRLRPSLAELLTEPVPARKTALTLALELLARIERARPSAAVAARVHPDIAAALAGPAAASRAALEARLRVPVRIEPDPGLPRDAPAIG